MEYPSNSIKGKQPEEPKKPEKNIEKVVTGEVVIRKKSLSKRFSEVFLGSDAKSVVSYIFMDVLIPAAKDMIVESVNQGAERMLFGEVRRRPGKPTNGHVSYSRYSSAPLRHREESRPMSRRSRATHNFDEIVLPTRGEAEEVIERLFDIVSRYETATVADLYDLVGIKGDYTDDKWGWSDLRGAGVSSIRGGYLLDLPRPEALD